MNRNPKLNFDRLLERLRRDEDVHADEVNAFLFHHGLRRCPHTEHDSDEDFAECDANSEGLNLTELYLAGFAAIAEEHVWDFAFLWDVGIKVEEREFESDLTRFKTR